MGQAKYVCAVHRFIQDLLLKTAPELLMGSGALKTDNEFKDAIDAAIASVTTPNARDRDYVRAIVDAAGEEMKPLCHLLRGAAECAGLKRMSDRYLDGERFREMLLRKDREKLERLNATVQKQSRRAAPVKVLMDVAAALDGREENYDGMDAAAKRKAARDMTRLIGTVAELRTAMDSQRDEIVSHVDAVGTKVDGLRFKGRRKSKYSDAQREVCDTCWNAAQRNSEVRHAINTRITYASVFNYYRRELAKSGVTTKKMFVAILHADRTRDYEARKRELDAKRDGTKRTCPEFINSGHRSTPAAGCGTIRGMGKRAIRAMLGAALALCCSAAQGAAVPRLPEPAHADTEVSTNVPFNTARSDAREFGVELSFAGTASNCVQVAFGRDADGDGDLSPEETGLALGWRAGSYFIEDVAGGRRFSEAAEGDAGGARSLSLRVSLDGSLRPRSAAATNGCGACFAWISESVPRWLYGGGWNMAKVTRRGVDAPEETVAVDCRYRFFRIVVR